LYGGLIEEKKLEKIISTQKSPEGGKTGDWGICAFNLIGTTEPKLLVPIGPSQKKF